MKITEQEAIQKLREMESNSSNVPTALEERLLEIVESLRDGGGEALGLLDSGRRSISMTDATECFYGSSGRGSRLAIRKIESAANLGFLIIAGNKRRQVGISKAGYDLLHRFGK